MGERQRANQRHSYQAKRSTEFDLAQRVLAPLWRGLVGYRAVALGYAAVLLTTAWSDYRQPVLAAAVLTGVGLWTALSTYGYLRPPLGGPGWLAWPDLVITMAAVGATVLVDTPRRPPRRRSVMRVRCCVVRRPSCGGLSSCGRRWPSGNGWPARSTTACCRCWPR